MGSAPIHVNKTEVNVATANATTKMVEMSIQISIKRSVSYMRVIDITSPAIGASIELLFNCCEKILY